MRTPLSQLSLTGGRWIMRAIGRAAAELLVLLVAGVISFPMLIGYAFGILLMWVLGIVSSLFLIAALFSGAMWLFTHSPHAFHMMLGFLAYAAMPFVLIAAMRDTAGDDSSRPRRGAAAGPGFENWPWQAHRTAGV
jgi:hypothetical protein